MRLGILSGELGIFVIDGMEELGEIQKERIMGQMPEGARLEDLAFFYVESRDWIVLNKDHALYEYYATIISYYIELSADGRRKASENAPSREVKEALRILDDVIWRRGLIKRWEGLRHAGIG